jgi:hypothetical protein
MKRLLEHVPSHTTVAAYAALFLALGGISYAAVHLAKNSVGAKQIKKNAVRSAEVKNQSLSCEDLDPAACAGDVTTRSKTVTLSSPECSGGGGTTFCRYPTRPVTAKCNPGERAMGGGSEGILEGDPGVAPSRFSNASQLNRPDPASGTPTGWTVDANGSTYASSSGPAEPAPPFTVYVVCAS